MQAQPRIKGTASEVVPLALPKGKKKLCELCQGAARLQCTKCRVTFYCNAEHQQDDWVGIHERICQLLVPIRTPKVLQQAETEPNKVELIEICRSVAQSKLSEGKHREALPAARCCLRYSKDVHGPKTVQMVPAYLLLADANMGLGDLAQVTELLAQAEWAVLKSPEHSVHHRLHRSLGRLHAATGNLEAALFDFANDIYFASEEYGLDSTVACGGYFLMAGVFAKQGKMPLARSLYSKVAQTWHGHLTKLLETHAQNVQDPDRVLEPSYAQRVEVHDLLKSMLEFEQNYSRKDSAQVALVAHCLAMLWFLGGDSLKCNDVPRQVCVGGVKWDKSSRPGTGIWQHSPAGQPADTEP
ncbi:zinc finger MYND domain-containing protein 12 isoform X2 [Anarrhichthys ocellatus]|uniref:zinc finger MYND domain-containing protein 12 isoform X2 n=1 Tax=Anarrhichthys ocellatus TaxID=433405 RepID=UPI0012EDB3F7|nr:zinc finger MYND domain-containing protein 12 isoform X2 [Anarrhichthys ocellatus]